MIGDRIAALRARAERLVGELHAVALAAKDPRTPWYAKALALGVVGYAASPIDPIPDVVPVLGYLDELLVLPVALLLVRRLLPQPVLRDARSRSRADGVDAGRVRWVVAALVVGGWIVVGYVIVRTVGVPV